MKCFLMLLIKKLLSTKALVTVVVMPAKTLKYILETHKIENEEFYYGALWTSQTKRGFARHDDAKKIVEECFEMIRCETVAKELV